MVQTPDTSVLEGNDEWRGRSAATTEESRLVVADEETDDGKGSNVDDGLKGQSEMDVQVYLSVRTHNTPESSLDGGGHRRTRVGSLGSSQTNQLGTS